MLDTWTKWLESYPLLLYGSLIMLESFAVFVGHSRFGLIALGKKVAFVLHIG